MVTADPPPAADLSQSSGEPDRLRTLRLSSWYTRGAVAIVALFLLLGTLAWLQRDRIAANLIDEYVAANGLEADYDIVSISPNRYVIANLVVGPAQSPDLTAESVTIEIGLSGLQPSLTGVAITRPKVSARLTDQRVSLGSLDPLIYAETQKPFAWPAIDLTIADGLARIASDYGTIAVNLNGKGRLDDGFAADLAARTKDFGTADCRSSAASLIGTIGTEAGRPSFEGDLDLRLLECAGLAVESAKFATSAALEQDSSELEASFEVTTGGASYLRSAVDRIDGRFDVIWRTASTGNASLDITHALRGIRITTEYGSLETVALEGLLRLSDDLSHAEWRSQVNGSKTELDPAIRAQFSDLRSAGRGTFVASLMAQFDKSLDQALAVGTLTAKISVQSDEAGLRADVPEAQLLAKGGDPVIALSQFSFERRVGEGNGRVQGDIRTGGSGLPAISGRVTQRRDGVRIARLALAEYRAGQDAIAVPRLQVRQAPSGRVQLDGFFEISGALPNGHVERLTGPVEGSWTSRDGLSIGRRCATVTFAALEYSGLSLTDNALDLCPGAEAPMIGYNDRLEVAIASEAIDLGGAMAQAPAHITATQADLTYPGAFEIKGLSAKFGRPGNAMQLSADWVEGYAGDLFNGRIHRASAASDTLPFDLGEINGDWSFSDGKLQIVDSSFVLREARDAETVSVPRFEPLSSTNARLVLDGENLRAEADMVHARSGNLLAKVLVEHELSSGEGRADFAVPGVTFTETFQPDDLSLMMRGVIADAEGTIDGKGEVSWSPDTLTSSGTFSTEDFDLAAAFGLVRGLRGEISFVDLIELTTAPSQVLEIESINPGVEALSGRILYSIDEGRLVNIEDARWPFMGGELALRPITLDFGGGDGQDYIFELVGIDAGSFVSEMDLTNIGASGTFDGTLPIHFDAKGNGSVRGGLAIARAPGGNVSYVGELTYEDLGAMANYAFQSLKSLDYSQMSVELNGDLGGEIITNFLLDGVRQGEGTSQNFITRQLAKLPIRFKVNVRSDNFSDLALIVRGLFVPSIFDDQAARRRLGIEAPTVISPAPFDALDRPGPNETGPPQNLPQLDEPAVQPSESDDPL